MLATFVEFAVGADQMKAVLFRLRAKSWKVPQGEELSDERDPNHHGGPVARAMPISTTEITNQTRGRLSERLCTVRFVRPTSPWGVVLAGDSPRSSPEFSRIAWFRRTTPRPVAGPDRSIDHLGHR
jgi:hypothetical protein